MKKSGRTNTSWKNAVADWNFPGNNWKDLFSGCLCRSAVCQAFYFLFFLRNFQFLKCYMLEFCFCLILHSCSFVWVFLCFFLIFMLCGCCWNPLFVRLVDVVHPDCILPSLDVFHWVELKTSCSRDIVFNLMVLGKVWLNHLITADTCFFSRGPYG